jgi:hypothetical protein
MKQEEMNDISTILVEATDERAAVIKQISKQTKPVVIVLPEQAEQIFRQPGDFFELKRLKRERGLSITLVISGHERIRNMARRQGFQVYTSAETCARALARRDRLYTMRGISLPGTTSLAGQARFIAQGDEDEAPPWSYDMRMQQTITTANGCTAQEGEQDEDTPWSYDVRMQQTITTANGCTAQEGEQDEDTPWSYDVRMQQATPITEMSETVRMQSQEQSGDDTPWSYDVQMEQDETPTEEHPRRTTWMLTEEELWNQKHHQPVQHDQRIPPAYLERAPFAGALNQPASLNSALPAGTDLSCPGDHNTNRTADTVNRSLREGYGSLKETPIPPFFTETLENLVALSGEKPGRSSYLQRVSLAGDVDDSAPYASAHNSGALGPTRLVGLSDEDPTQPIPTVRVRPVRYAPDTEPLHPAIETQPLVQNEYAGSRLALMLTALLILGIVGGVCCGYVLTLMHVNLTVLSSTISSL